MVHRTKCFLKNCFLTVFWREKGIFRNVESMNQVAHLDILGRFGLCPKKFYHASKEKDGQ